MSYIREQPFLLIAICLSALVSLTKPDGVAQETKQEAKQKALILDGQRGPLHSVAFSPDGGVLVSGSSFLWLGGAEFIGGDLGLWDVKTGKKEVKTGKKTEFAGKLPPEIRPRFRESAVNFRSVRFSPDGQLLAAGIGRFELTGGKWSGLIVIWDVPTGKQRAILRGHTDEVLAVQFSPDGRLLASGSKDSTIKLWDVKTGKETATLKGQNVGAFAFSADSQALASTGGKLVKLWDVNTGKEKAAFEGHPESASPLAFSPDLRTLASSSKDSIQLRDVETGKVRATLQGHKEPVRSAAFSPDGRFLISGGGRWSRLQPKNTGGRGELKLWDISTGKEIAAFEEHQDEFSCVAFSQDGRRLVAGNMDGTIKLWDLTGLLPPAPRKALPQKDPQ